MLALLVPGVQMGGGGTPSVVGAGFLPLVGAGK